MTQITVAKQSPPKKRAKPLPASEPTPEPALLPEPPALKPLPPPIPASHPQPQQTTPPAFQPLPQQSTDSQTQPQQPTPPAFQPLSRQTLAYMPPHTKTLATQTIPPPQPLPRPLANLVSRTDDYHRRAFEAPPKTTTKAFKPRPKARQETTTRSSTPRPAPPPLLPVIRFPALPPNPPPAPISGPKSKWAKQAAKKKEKRRLEAEQAAITGLIGPEQTSHLKKRSGKEAKRSVMKQAVGLSVANHAARVEKMLGPLYKLSSSTLVDWSIKLKNNLFREASRQELIGATMAMEAAVRLEGYSKNLQLPSSEITESAKERINKAFYN